MKVLFVCLGNICRSPTAEGVFRRMLAQAAPGLDVEVDSAGTAGYHIGEPPDPRSQRAAKARGVDLSGLRARRVTPGDFSHFDIILAMDADNLADLEAMRPANARARLQRFLDYAPEQSRRDVPDPYYGDADGFEIVLDLCAAASRGLIAALQEMA
jgi:protein-tyrosine phosphatase